MDKAKKLVKVLAYIRYSCHNQDEGNSVAAQTTTIEKYADTHEMEIENYYIDMAKTGRNTNRPNYQKMMDDIKNGNVEAKIIVVRAIDRLHRNAKNQLSDLEWFAENGIRLISVTDGIDTNTETSRLLTTIKAAVAEDFSETLSRNTRAGMLECAKQGRHLGGTPPIGYKVNAEGFYEIDELKAPIIREIYRLYLQDMGYSYIIKFLKEKGYQTANGNDFNKTAIRSILKNPKYMGTYIYDRSTPKNSEGRRNSNASKEKYIQIKDGMPAIIPEEDFQKVQVKMSNHEKQYQHRNSKNYYPLNGKLYCAECGKAFSGNVTSSKGKQYFTYKGSCSCGIKSIKMQNLNQFVFYAVQQCIFNPDTQDKIIQKINTKLAVQNALQSTEANALMNQIHGLEAAQNNLTGYLEAGKATQTIMDKLQKNEAELQILKTQLEAKSKGIPIIDEVTYQRLVRQFMNYMCTEKSSEAYELKEAVIKDIKIDENKIEIQFNQGVTVDDDTINYFNNNKED